MQPLVSFIEKIGREREREREREILKEVVSQNILNDVIHGRNDPLYKILLSLDS